MPLESMLVNGCPTDEVVEKLDAIAQEMDLVSGEVDDVDLDEIDHEQLLTKYNDLVAQANSTLTPLVAEMKGFYDEASKEWLEANGDDYLAWIEDIEDALYEDAEEVDDILDGSALAGIPKSLEDL